MYAAFLGSGYEDSQVLLALEDRAGFAQSDRPDGARVLTTGGTTHTPTDNPGGSTSWWIGVSSRRRMWAVEGFRKDGIDTALEDGIRDAGFRFLDASGSALDGITTHCSLGGVDRSRMFAFDGLHAAILVTEDRTLTFCQQVSSGTYNLGVFAKPTSVWQDAVTGAAASLLVDSLEGTAQRARCGIDTYFRTPSLRSSAAVVHMTPTRVVVHQRCDEEAMESATEVLSFHHVQTHVDEDGVVSAGPSSGVQDACTIFSTRTSGGAQARAVMKESTRFSKPQPRAVPYEDARPSKRRKKDPNRPRGYISAFNFFVQDKRRTYVQNRPNAKGHALEHNNEINKALGKIWKRATEEEKRVYEERATADKLRYLQEVSSYHPPEGYEHLAPRINVPKGVSTTAWDQDFAGGTTTQICRPQPAYTHFAHQERNGILLSRSNLAKTQMSKAFGQRWQGMPTAETELYHELEDADTARYEQEAYARDTASRLA